MTPVARYLVLAASASCPFFQAGLGVVLKAALPSEISSGPLCAFKKEEWKKEQVQRWAVGMIREWRACLPKGR